MIPRYMATWFGWVDLTFFDSDQHMLKLIFLGQGGDRTAVHIRTNKWPSQSRRLPDTSFRGWQGTFELPGEPFLRRVRVVGPRS